jgi:hypothetical protein
MLQPFAACVAALGNRRSWRRSRTALKSCRPPKIGAAGQRLAEIETHIRRELGAMTATVDEAERSETKRQIEALQQVRIEQVLEVQRLHYELDSSTDGGG